MSRLNLNFKILGEILDSDTGRVSHLSMSRLNLNFKISGEMVVSDTLGCKHLSMSRLNLNFKILGEILVSNPAEVGVGKSAGRFTDCQQIFQLSC